MGESSWDIGAYIDNALRCSRTMETNEYYQHYIGLIYQCFYILGIDRTAPHPLSDTTLQPYRMFWDSESNLAYRSKRHNKPQSS